MIHDDDDGVRVVTISNPSKKNALTRASLEELRAAFVAVPESARAVVLRGDPAGGAFSSGFFISAIDDDEKERGLDPIEAPAHAIETCPVPVVAAIEGACMGGAFELAMSCTVRVASRSSLFAMPPARLGLVYTQNGLARFLRSALPSRVQRLFLTGERIDATTALSWGLVDQVVEDGSDPSFVEARRIAAVIAKNAPLAVAGTLDAIRRLSRHADARAIDDDDRAAIAAARARTFSSLDLAEGVRAFVEKRPPLFRGE